MASREDVQTENGFTAIAHVILEELAKIKLSPTQYRIILVIWRYTYGFRRKEHEFSLAFLSTATGCDKRQIQRELKGLVDRAIIVQKVVAGKVRKISFNKHYTQWINKSTIGEIDNGETDNGEIDNGETVNSAIGEIDNSAIGEIDNQERNIKTNIKEIYISIFDHWNSKGIIKHKKLSDKAKGKINSLLDGGYTEAEIKKSIDVYSEIVEGEQYFFKYKWTFEEFLQRGFEKFKDEEVAKSNYLSKGQAQSRDAPKEKLPDDLPPEWRF